MREYLGVDLAEQAAWKTTATAMQQWREAVEDAGIHVFKDTFKQKSVSGFCLNDEEFPVIYVNNSTPFSRQIFTLFHELAHILVDLDGITKQNDSFIDGLQGASREFEVFCNRFAGELLVPLADFEARRPEEYDDATIESLANIYVVSREVILRRLFDRGIITRNFYRQRAEEWHKAFEDQEKKKEGRGGNYYNTQAAYLGERFLKLAFSRYHKGLCSAEQLADHLHVRVKSLAGLEPLAL